MAERNPKTYPLLLDAPSYYSDLISAINAATTSIDIIALVVAYDSSTHELFEALFHALKRGVKVTVALDHFTEGEIRRSHLAKTFTPARRIKPTREAFDRLTKAGALVKWLGTGLYLHPYTGRTHTKFSVVDNTVYAFGGVNLYGMGLASTDYMLRYHDPALASDLRRVLGHIIAHDSSLSDSQSPKIEIAQGTVWIDNGKPGKSVIYDRAVELAKEASSAIYVSQYCVSGRLSNHLLNIPTKYYFNQPKNVSYPHKLLIMYDQYRQHIPNSYSRSNYLHAKFILFTMKDGSRVALSGSHNFSWGGVIFGTREIALETTDSTTLNQLQEFWQHSVR